MRLRSPDYLDGVSRGAIPLDNEMLLSQCRDNLLAYCRCSLHLHETRADRYHEFNANDRCIDFGPDFMKVLDIIRLLENDGWRLQSTRGSHRQYKHPLKRGRVTVAGGLSDDVAPGTLNSILKQSQLKGKL